MMTFGAESSPPGRRWDPFSYLEQLGVRRDHDEDDVARRRDRGMVNDSRRRARPSASAFDLVRFVTVTFALGEMSRFAIARTHSSTADPSDALSVSHQSFSFVALSWLVGRRLARARHPKIQRADLGVVQDFSSRSRSDAPDPFSRHDAVVAHLKGLACVLFHQEHRSSHLVHHLYGGEHRAKGLGVKSHRGLIKHHSGRLEHQTTGKLDESLLSPERLPALSFARSATIGNISRTACSRSATTSAVLHEERPDLDILLDCHLLEETVRSEVPGRRRG